LGARAWVSARRFGGVKGNDDMIDIATAYRIAQFWKELGSALKFKPTYDEIDEVLGRYCRLGIDIEADADENPEHREMLDHVIAIRDRSLNINNLHDGNLEIPAIEKSEK
jgi:hypothetical protein